MNESTAYYFSIETCYQQLGSEASDQLGSIENHGAWNDVTTVVDWWKNKASVAEQFAMGKFTSMLHHNDDVGCPNMDRTSSVKTVVSLDDLPPQMLKT